MNYSASFEYMNPLGDPRLSVLDELVIHDLIRNVQIPRGEYDGILDFLVNDKSDLFDIPMLCTVAKHSQSTMLALEM